MTSEVPDLVQDQIKDADLMSRAFLNLKKKGQQTSKGAIRSRIEALEKRWETMQTRHREIMEEASEEDYADEYFKNGFMEATEEIFLEQKGQFLDALELLEANRAPSAPTPAPRPESTSRKMPTIQLPQFSGKYAEWAPFKDMFTAFLTHDAKLTNAERLYYLRSSLSGEAADLIKSIPITDDNYPRAWTKLTTHYDNKRKLIHLCLESLFQLAPAPTESSSALKALRNGTTEVRETLAALQRPVDKMDDLLVHLTVRRLDSRTRRDWELSLGDTSTPTRWEELDSFLKSRIEALEMSSEQKSTTSTGDQSSAKKAASAAKKPKSPALTVHNATTTRVRRCSYCQGEHYISTCDKFIACSLDNRHKFVSEKQLCFNCLGVHRIADCRSKGTCATCRGRHHTLLHRESSSQTQVTPQASLPKDRPPNESAHSLTTATTPTEPTKTCLCSTANANATASHTTQTSSKPRAVLLATALVQVSADHDRASYARALVDPCSEASFMAESLAQRIRAPRQSAFMPVTGVGAVPSYIAKSKTAVLISPHFKSSPRWKLTALILPRLTDYIADSQSVPHSDTFLDGLTLADPMNSTGPIEIIIGADLYPQLIEEGIRKGTDSGLIAQATGLGWILTGAVSAASTDPSTVSSFSCHVDLDLASLLTRFWQQEEVVRKKSTPLSKEERECEDHFIATHKRNADGRYVLRLPFKSNLSELGNSKEAALRALSRTENRFRKQPEFKEKYDNFMQEYISLGHMEEFSSLDSSPTDTPSFLLPHHGIFKTHGDTSKLRVVFNGSVKLPSGLAINDCLYVGRKLQLDPFDVILRWRAFRLAFSADIKKMFRQIRIAEKDQVYQQIVWRIGSTIKIFNLCTVTYGLGPSPYQALRTLQQLVIDEGANFPRAAQILLDQTYVDDIFAGADTVDEALALKTELVELLNAGGFPLGKWTANDPELLADVPEDEQASTQLFSWSESQTIAVLGLAWHPLLDVFCFQFDVSAKEENLTKRQALSIIAQLYDPVGWITPVTISFKIFMQSLWYDGVEWDDPLPSALRDRWRLLMDDLPHLKNFSVPRWTGSCSEIAFAEIHAFSDASERAFAACLYLRTVNNEGKVQCHLLASKSKVAPLKQVSLPRLELCGAVLLVRLASRVRQTLRLENAPCFCWTDSTITLAWIKQEPTAWKTYVANRVSKIQTTLPDAVWLHISGVENPADLPSRGILASDLAKSSLWIHGPAFLIGSSAPWNRSNNCNLDDLPEPLERRAVSCLATRANLSDLDIIARFSLLSRLVNTIARCLQFPQRVRAKIEARGSVSKITQDSSQTTALTPNDMLRSLLALVHWVQHVYFAEEIGCLEKGDPLPRKSVLLRLYPILDAQNHLRVGGRLRHSLLHPDERHPLILPQESHLVKLLVLDAHHKTLHGGTQLTLNYLRQRFWIIRGRQVVKSTILTCIRCWRQRAQPATQLMGDLPSKRVQPSRPFLHSGVDYAGPIYLRFSKGRGAKSYKGYICVFVCFSTRAVHLEAVSSYSTADFLGAYKRFTARRGICASLTSDCGLNFVGADKELRLLFKQAGAQHTEIQRLLAADGTEWRFNPPGAPHFGGLWEAAVKSVKFHLKRVIGEALLTFEEMTTLLAQIEACLNSRPLHPLSDDPEDLSALTPGHFLIGEPTLTIPEPSLLDVPVSRLDKWQLLRQMQEQFWRRWSQEYLQCLQIRPKWQTKATQAKVGDLCLLRSDQYPPCKWQLARITAVYPGADEVVRVVDVKTATSSYTRPTTKISLMPQENPYSSVPAKGGRDVPKPA